MSDNGPPRGWRRVLAALGCAVAGAVVAVLALLVHRRAVEVGGVSWPWGLGLATFASVSGSLGVQAARLGGLPVLAYGAGWCLVVFVLLDGRPEGDYLVAADARGWGFLAIASLGVVAATVFGTMSDGTSRRARAADPDDLLARPS